MFLPLNMAAMVTVTSFIIIAILAAAVSYAADQYLLRRTEEQRAARLHLQRHFQAIEIVTSDPAVSDKAKALVGLFSVSVGRERIAVELAKKIRSLETPKLDAKRSALIGEVFSELEALRKHRPDLDRAFTDIFRSGFLAMLMRFPSTEETLPYATLFASDDGATANRKVATAVFASSGDDCPIYPMPAAA